ncbi:receptor expression-enhancing protein 5-like isoform X2 [Bolinopsis microptera]|uniref:receptor expression-enhancing protein 5-like isoform X2 n=1 Tax=Bolinopsis microptera TaxID=2820187 RepID=UPI00307954A4
MDAIKERLMNLTDKDKQKLGLISALVLTIVWLAVGIGSSLVCSVICFVYPAYKSFKAVESPQGDDDTQWLTYWIVYSTFNILEYFADIIFFWIPMFQLLKCLFLLWCMWPIPNNGATVVYKKILRPFLLKNEEKIDARLEKVTGKVNKYVDDAKREASEFADSSAGVMLAAGAQVATETASQQLDDALNEDADKDKEI